MYIRFFLSGGQTNNRNMQNERKTLPIYNRISKQRSLVFPGPLLAHLLLQLLPMENVLLADFLPPADHVMPLAMQLQDEVMTVHLDSHCVSTVVLRVSCDVFPSCVVGRHLMYRLVLFSFACVCREFMRKVMFCIAMYLPLSVLIS